jgi:hypothetical protein
MRALPSLCGQIKKAFFAFSAKLLIGNENHGETAV